MTQTLVAFAAVLIFALVMFQPIVQAYGPVILKFLGEHNVYHAVVLAIAIVDAVAVFAALVVLHNLHASLQKH